MARNSGNIKGLNIRTGPNASRNAILALFADDATVFLSEDDKPSELWKILDKWCEASGAKFNKPKTVAIPVGSAAYREQLRKSGKLNSDHDDTEKLVMFDILNILMDGEATRILGAFLGNKAPAEQKWNTVIEKITASLARWNNHHPTMIGRRIIAQIIIGGMTQFLTRAQGMPDKIEQKLTQIAWRFIWNVPTASPPILNEFLFMPFTEGGLEALDLSARIEAINLMKLKQIIRTDPLRP
ncbi:hypothetical protein DL93DRAFT_2068423, partial [Clavulina sp. PMI_390]